MEKSISFENRLMQGLHSCPKLCTHLNLQGLACLAAACSSCNAACLIVCKRDAAKLLADVFEALASVHHSSRQQKQQLDSLVWLLHAVPTAATPSAFNQLLRTPLVPLGLAKQLVAAGMRISYAQLLTAARSRVPGVEAWVQAQQQLAMQSDIPAAAVAICCNEDWVSIDVSYCSVHSCVVAEQQAQDPVMLFMQCVRVGKCSLCTHASGLHQAQAAEDMFSVQLLASRISMRLNMQQHLQQNSAALLTLNFAVAAADQVMTLQAVDVVSHDLLQLALNCSDHRTAAMALDCMSHQLEPCVVRSLLLTAVARQHAAVWHLLLEQPHVIQHIDAATYAAVVELLLLQNSYSYVTVVLRANPDLPEAAQPDADAVAQLLLAAMALSRFARTEQQHACIAASNNATLLQAALPQVVRQREEADRDPLHNSQRAWDKASAELRACLQKLCYSWQLQAARTISSSGFERLLLAALQLRRGASAACIRILCQLPAAASMSSCQMVHVLQAAFQTQQVEAVESLYQLPAFKQLGRVGVAKLLLIAAECGDSEGLYKLRWLESAKQLSNAAVLPAVEAAVKGNDRQSTWPLWILPATQQLTSNEVQQLLQTAVGCNSCMCTELCALPAAQQLGSKAVQQLLQSAVTCGSGECEAAVQAASGANLRELNSAVRQCSSCCSQL
jgi:hypothetical protein